MRIKTLVSWSGHNFSYVPGEVVDVDAKIAKDRIAAGLAEDAGKAPLGPPANADQAVAIGELREGLAALAEKHKALAEDHAKLAEEHATLAKDHDDLKASLGGEEGEKKPADDGKPGAAK